MTLAGLPSLKLPSDEIWIDSESTWQAIDHRPHHRSMAFTKGGNLQKIAECVASHNDKGRHCPLLRFDNLGALKVDDESFSFPVFGNDHVECNRATACWL